MRQNSRPPSFSGDMHAAVMQWGVVTGVAIVLGLATMGVECKVKVVIDMICILIIATV